MPVAFLTVTAFLALGSFLSGGWNSVLIVHSDSGFQRKAGPLNQLVTLLTFVASILLGPTSAGLPFDGMYLHCPLFVFSYEDLKTLHFFVDVAQDSLAICPICLFIIFYVQLLFY